MGKESLKNGLLIQSYLRGSRKGWFFPLTLIFLGERQRTGSPNPNNAGTDLTYGFEECLWSGSSIKELAPYSCVFVRSLATEFLESHWSMPVIRGETDQSIGIVVLALLSGVFIRACYPDKDVGPCHKRLYARMKPPGPLLAFRS